MAGYVGPDGDLIITNVSGPGTRASCQLFAVQVDGNHAQEFCDQVYHDSQGKCDYIGDWHCHPGFSLRPSKSDHSAMKLIAETGGIIPNPVSLIYSRLTGKFKTYEWTENDGLVMIPSSILGDVS